MRLTFLAEAPLLFFRVSPVLLLYPSSYAFHTPLALSRKYTFTNLLAMTCLLFQSSPRAALASLCRDERRTQCLSCHGEFRTTSCGMHVQKHLQTWLYPADDDFAVSHARNRIRQPSPRRNLDVGELRRHSRRFRFGLRVKQGSASASWTHAGARGDESLTHFERLEGFAHAGDKVGQRTAVGLEGDIHDVVVACGGRLQFSTSVSDGKS